MSKKPALTTKYWSPKLPDKFKDFALSVTEGKNIDPAVITHCNRELLHAQLKVILDDEFLDAYEHGVVINGIDGIQRRFYPRLFTYSADYPEKSSFYHRD